MARRQGGTLGGFTPLSTPNAPTDLSVSTSIGSAEVSFTAPADTGDGAVTSYIVTAIDESTGASFGATGSASPITVSPSPGGTFKIRAQAVNAFGPGRLTEFEAGNLILAGTAVYGWGINNNGQLGDGTKANKSSPVQVGALINWSQVAAGNTTTASVKTDGTLWTWGYNVFGHLGDGTVVAKSSPVQIGALTNWAQVSAGFYHTAAITTGGELYVWGANSDGRIGDGTTVNKSSPVQIGALTNWAQVSAANIGSGAHTAAVKTDGTLWSWGNNGYGRLGDNTTANKSSPVQIGALTTWSQVSASSNFTAAVKTDGTLWTWGAYFSGKLGHGDAISRSSPVQVGALTNWAQVSTGNSHAAAVTTGGELYAWGYNGFGNLGTNNTVNTSSPVQVGALTTWSQVACGAAPHTAAVKTDGTLWTWGRNGVGQLADGTVASRSSPVQVGAETTWTQVAAGGDHTTAILGVV